MTNITRILKAVERGERHATDELLTTVYHELRQLAAQLLAHERTGQTLQGTALVHEAYLRLVGAENQSWQGRRHFFAAAAEAMRRILVDNARRKAALKHGGDRRRVPLSHIDIAAGPQGPGLLELNEALSMLESQAPRPAELVKLRYFAGLTLAEAAELLDVSVASASRDWAYARSWLYVALADG